MLVCEWAHSDTAGGTYIQPTWHKLWKSSLHQCLGLHCQIPPMSDCWMWSRGQWYTATIKKRISHYLQRNGFFDFKFHITEEKKYPWQISWDNTNSWNPHTARVNILLYSSNCGSDAAVSAVQPEKHVFRLLLGHLFVHLHKIRVNMWNIFVHRN